MELINLSFHIPFAITLTAPFTSAVHIQVLPAFSFLFPSDINELNLPKTCEIVFPDPDDLLNFKLIICPDEVSDEQGLAQLFVGVVDELAGWEPLSETWVGKGRKLDVISYTDA